MNSRFSGGIRCTAAMPRSRASRSGGKSLLNSRSSASVATSIIMLSGRRSRLIAAQQRRGPRIVPALQRREQKVAQAIDVAEPQVQPLAGDRMHPVRRVPARASRVSI